MSDLQLGLLIVGAVAVAAVLIYNRVQVRRAERQAERAFGSAHSDVLLGAAEARREPTLEARRGAPDDGEAAAALPDPQLDYVIEILAARPLAGAALSEAWAPLERRFAGHARLAGEGEAGWQRVAAGDAGAYRTLRAGLQLVSRAGAVGEADLIEFRSEVESLAARLGAAVEAPEMRPAVEAARSLDEFCANADIQVAFRVLAAVDAPFGAAPVRKALAEAGLEPLAGGARHALRDAAGRTLFEVSVQAGEAAERVDALALALDVPRTPEPARSFQAMVRLARQLAGALGGTLVDDNGNALDERSLEAIALEVESVRKALGERGVEPGGAAALRLFA